MSIIHQVVRMHDEYLAAAGKSHQGAVKTGSPPDSAIYLSADELAQLRAEMADPRNADLAVQLWSLAFHVREGETTIEQLVETAPGSQETSDVAAAEGAHVPPTRPITKP